MSSQNQPSIDENLKVKNQAHNIKSRELITKGFIILYFVFICTAIGLWALDVFFPLQGRVEQIKDMILTLSAIFAGPLGLIVGYFFWGDRDNPS